MPLGFQIAFGGQTFDETYVNNNGNLTFEGPLADLVPFDLTQAPDPIVAPFFADVDTRVGAVARYGTGTVDGRPAFGVTWPGVGCYPRHASLSDAFQAILVDRSDVAAGAFDIELDYDPLQWDQGQAPPRDKSGGTTRPPKLERGRSRAGRTSACGGRSSRPICGDAAPTRGRRDGASRPRLSPAVARGRLSRANHRQSGATPNRPARPAGRSEGSPAPLAIDNRDAVSMRRPSSLPLRWDTAVPPDALTLAAPPARMAPLRGARPLKRWRYVAAFSEELMLCAATAAVGPARSSWWAVWDRRGGALHERTRLVGPGLVRFDHAGRLRVRDRGVAIDLAIDEGCAVESINAHANGYVWTRKQAARPVRGRVVVGSRVLALDGLAIVDDTAGYHARETEWWWSAGVGHGADGAPVGWNVVVGVNDGPRASERSVWVAGDAREVGPVVFAPDLSAVDFAEGDRIEFAVEAVRERRDDLVVVRSTYRQPFGTVAGSLPGVGRVHGGLGVMEHHVARW